MSGSSTVGAARAGTLSGLEVQGTGASAPGAAKALLALTVTLVILGLLSVYSASSFIAQSEGLPDTYYLVEQATHAGVGLLALTVTRFVDYRWYRKLAWPTLFLTLFLLILLVVPWTADGVAQRVNGARRWLTLGPITVQPSELAKLAVIVWTASLAVKKQERLHSLRYGLLPFLIVVGLICALVTLQPHFSAALMIAGLAGLILFVAGGRIGHFVFLGLLSLPVLWDQIMNSGYRMNRILAVLNPSARAADIGYQLQQSLIAIGSGGVLGVGFGQSRQKLYYLPEPQNDFIFSIIAEEWGLVGSVLVVGLFLAWAIIALRIGRSAPDLFGRLLAVGITGLVAVTAFGHIGVTLGLLPTTGMNLPFISAGGTHLVLGLGSTGVLLNVASQRR